MISQLLLLGKLEIIVFLKKNIYRTNNIQKVLMPLTEEYTKILMRVSEIFDSIYFKKFSTYILTTFLNLIKYYA